MRIALSSLIFISTLSLPCLSTNLIKCISDKYETYQQQRLQYISHMYGYAWLNYKYFNLKITTSSVNQVRSRIKLKKDVTNKPSDKNCLNIIKPYLDIDEPYFLSLRQKNNKLFYFEDDEQWGKIVNILKD